MSSPTPERVKVTVGAVPLIEDSIAETGRSLIEHGVVKLRAA